MNTFLLRLALIVTILIAPLCSPALIQTEHAVHAQPSTQSLTSTLHRLPCKLSSTPCHCFKSEIN